MLGKVCDKITGHITLQLDQCAQIVAGCDTNCQGHFYQHCAVVEDILAKKCAKIDAHAVQQLGQCYGLLAAFGVTLPTEDELQAHAAGSPRPWPNEQPPLGDGGGAPPGEYPILPEGYSVPDVIQPWKADLPASGGQIGPMAQLPPGQFALDFGPIAASLACLCRDTDRVPDETFARVPDTGGPLTDPTYPIDEK